MRGSCKVTKRQSVWFNAIKSLHVRPTGTLLDAVQEQNESRNFQLSPHDKNPNKLIFSVKQAWQNFIWELYTETFREI